MDSPYRIAPVVDMDHLTRLIERFYALAMPDQKLVEEIMIKLGIHEIVDLEMALNRYQKPERDATMKLLERYIPDLASQEEIRWEKAKQVLHDIFYPIFSSDEEAIL